MMGTGERLNRLFRENSLIVKLIGIGYSLVITIAPMIIVTGTVFLMGRSPRFVELDYAARSLYSSSVMYAFMFSLLITTPVTAVVGKYLSDMIYLERYDEIMPCFYTCLGICGLISSALGIPFALHEYRAGGVDSLLIFLSYLGFLCAVFMTYTMSFLNICKDFLRVTLYYGIGMGVTLALSVVITQNPVMPVIPSFFASLDCGLLLTAGLAFARVRQCFQDNNGNYHGVVPYFRRYWAVLLSNVFYITGLYVHDFVYWGTDLRVVVANSFISADVYDIASFLGLLTNISATVIYISDTERNFRDKYKTLMESITGGRLENIKLNEQRVFRQTRYTLVELVRKQFIICVVVYLLCVVFLPSAGISSLVMQIYPCLAAGYFVMFAMYAVLNLQYYFADNVGAFVTSLLFFCCTYVGALYATLLPRIWYGIGLFAGAFIAWSFGFFRLRWYEAHFEEKTFCEGNIIAYGTGKEPGSVVFVRGAENNKYSGKKVS